MSKRKHVTLELSKKVEILKEIDRGTSYSNLAMKYGIGKATVSSINKNREKIIQYVVAKADAGPSSRKTLKLSANPLVEKVLFTWFLQERAKGTPISGEILCEKAKSFHKNMSQKGDFHASQGWLQKFKKRFGIRQLTVTGESLSSDYDAVLPFVEKLKELIQKNNLTSDQLYNADESGLFWRVLPNKTLAHSGEKSAPGRKVSKERITFMPCCNASGTHKLRLLILGKSMKPRTFGNSRIPVWYKGQNKSWVTREIFHEWFHVEFVPSVRRRMKELNLSEKAILILDNAPGHPTDLTSDDGKISVLFLPPNCTPLLQPMDQHVIQAIKLFYRKNLLRKIVEADTDIPQTLKNINLKDVVFSLDEGWKNVSADLIKKSWSKLRPQDDSSDDEDEIPLARLARQIAEKKECSLLKNELQEIIQISKHVDESLTNNEIREWALGQDEIQCDVSLTDTEIIQEVNEVSDSEENAIENPNLVKHRDAVSAFDTCIAWASQNNVVNHQIISLEELRKQANELHSKKVKQQQITSFFGSLSTKNQCNVNVE